ncbi:hypothetical protein [Marinitenerispora sediminis]|uniref:Uncharacterized protein n=1 Tax=Marinitenerispora sediminis TaxID=1931232 RepID=A0A368T6B1_9ACTN|nr:hypothetical protein [Marinitenerispora sediminis]RCV55371.1 hypothetical protein DEF28_06200 [Marinitenerispora sediminis]RCV59162.1 hypothetical protein DEF23_07795 [Marinitenerispora sediminis]RCV59188.1 hypothetical protein DEF24_10770 [Marinitenerispora sediminis]
MSEMYLVSVPFDATTEIFPKLEWLREQVPDKADEIRRLAVLLSEFGGREQPLPLSLTQAQLLAAPGLWGIRRHDYENFLAQWKAQLIDHGRVDIGVVL